MVNHTRTRTINEWGSDDTVWIDHYAFTVILARIRELCYLLRVNQMDIEPDVVRSVVRDLGMEFSESRRAIESMGDKEFEAWCKMLLLAA